MNSEIRFPLTVRIPLAFGLVLVSLLPTFVGCGGESQADMMMRAARRARPKDDEEDEKKAPPPRQDVAKTEAPVSQDGQPANDDAAEDQPEVVLTPIEERKPEEPLTVAQRRKMAYSNLEKIAEALHKYSTERKGFPARYTKTNSGIPALSWRVELLPYLGHQDLYNQFDKNTPWNKEPNKSLLKFIPDVYVSPERFDTKTNFMGPANEKFIFGLEDRMRRLHRVEDGLENTIMLVEVGDDQAAEWTAPVDFSPKDTKHLSAVLRGHRGDGTFAAWANGWTVLLARGLTDSELENAFTCDAGDGQVAGKIHREVSLRDPSDAAIAAEEASKKMDIASGDPSEMESDDASGSRPPSVASNLPIEPAMTRNPIPKSSELADANEKLRRIYAAQIRDAKTDEEKTKLVKTMLKDAGKMDSDLAGAYALQSAAMKMAIDAAAPAQLIQAIDQRVGLFEVDAYEENVSNLVSFGESLSGRDPETVSGDEFMDRAVQVIRAGIVDNDFMRASAVARIAYRLTGQKRDEEIPKLLNKLRIQLGAAQKEFDKAKDSLALYRIDPSDAASGATFGRFLCFIKGDWDTGLPLIAAAGNQEVMEVAKMDLEGAKTNEDKVALGDAWWALSRRARGAYRQAAQDRAVMWYEQAYARLPDSLDRLHVKNRIDEADESDGSSPLALSVQLADEMSVDLTVSLAALGYSPQNRANRRAQGSSAVGGRDEYD